MAEPGPSAFHHDSLPDGHIRLLRLVHFSPVLPIQCSLATYRLTSQLSYAAVSYTWGKIGGVREPIEVNGQRLEVQRNLLDFLRTLQTWQESRALWVDAICVNQKMVEERNHQVRLMSTIYKTAEEVLVWLGPATYASEDAMDFLHDRRYQDENFAETAEIGVRNERLLDDPDGHTTTRNDSLFSDSSAAAPWTSSSPLLGLGVGQDATPDGASYDPNMDFALFDEETSPVSPPGNLAFGTPDSQHFRSVSYSSPPTLTLEWQPSTDSSMWNAVSELCRREYWRRVWILQEVILARYLTIFCGSKKMSKADLEAVFTRPDNGGSGLAPYRATPIADTTRTDLRWSFAAQILSMRDREESRTLADLLFQYQDTRCHDVRDKIFALLSLASDCGPGTALQADYSLDKETLFFKVIEFCDAPNTVQIAVLLQNLLEIEPGVRPRVWLRSVAEETWKQQAARTHLPLVPIWTSFKGTLGVQKHSSVDLQCFEYLSQRPEVALENGEEILLQPYAWFATDKAKSGDNVYHLTGCPLAFIFRGSNVRQVFVSLAILRRSHLRAEATTLMQGVFHPKSLPPLHQSVPQDTLPMTRILVDRATLVSVLVLSYEPTQIVNNRHDAILEP